MDGLALWSETANAEKVTDGPVDGKCVGAKREVEVSVPRLPAPPLTHFILTYSPFVLMKKRRLAGWLALAAQLPSPLGCTAAREHVGARCQGVKQGQPSHEDLFFDDLFFDDRMHACMQNYNYIYLQAACCMLNFLPCLTPYI